MTTAVRTKSEQWVNGNKTFTYTYDKNSNLLTANDNNIQYEYTYDHTDLLEQIDRTSTNTPTVTFKYSYDQIGNLTQTDELIANNLTATTIYKYADPRYLNTEIIQTGTGLTTKDIKFSYNTTGDNDKIERYLDSILTLTTTNTYDTHGRLKGITQRNRTGIIAQSTYALDQKC
jgi:hypothetical protein